MTEERLQNLVLTVKPGDEVQIGQCKVVFVEMRNTRALVSFQAPKSVRIQRLDRQLKAKKNGTGKRK